MKKKDTTCLQQPFRVWKEAVSYIQEALWSHAEPKKKSFEDKHHHHFTIYWKTSLFAKYNPENISDNKKQPSSIGLSIYFFPHFI